VDQEELLREQAERLQKAFYEGVVWTVPARGDEPARYEWGPLVEGLEPDYSFKIETLREERCVVVEFAVAGGPPGLRWLHRFEPPYPAEERTDLLASFQEGVECGWLARSLARVAPGTTPVWTDFSWRHPSRRWAEAMQHLADGDLELAVEVLTVDPVTPEADAVAASIKELSAADAVEQQADLRDAIWRSLREQGRRERDRHKSRR
jgi:hypothetical protein